MKVAAKCQITLFYPLSHLLRECKRKPEPVLQQFNYKYHIQPPVKHTQRRAAWFLVSLFLNLLCFLTFCQSLRDTWIPSYLRSAGGRSLLGVFCSPPRRWMTWVRGVWSASAPQLQPPFPAEDTGGFCAHTRRAGIYLGSRHHHWHLSRQIRMQTTSIDLEFALTLN